MRVHVNHHGLYSLACFFSALSPNLRPAAARRQHKLLGWRLDGSTEDHTKLLRAYRTEGAL